MDALVSRELTLGQEDEPISPFADLSNKLILLKPSRSGSLGSIHHRQSVGSASSPTVSPVSPPASASGFFSISAYSQRFSAFSSLFLLRFLFLRQGRTKALHSIM
jgi:hypothetical protein